MATFQLDKLFAEMYKDVSNHWNKNKIRTDELRKKMWELLSFFNFVGIVEESQYDYKITFSPTFYVNDELGSKTPRQIICELVSIFDEYGWDYPEIIKTIYDLKLFLESYRETENFRLEIINLNNSKK